MFRRGMLFLIACLAIGWGPALAEAAEPEAFEVGADRVGDLPRGKEADGILGDFVLRNDRIEALISGNLPGRKANMTTNSRAPTPGCLYDLSVRGSNNDQLTCLAPGSLEGWISSVRIIDGEPGRALVRAERSAETGKGLEEVHDYILERGAEHLLVFSSWRNRGSTALKLKPAPFLKGLINVTSAGAITYADAQNPNDRQGYAWAAMPREGAGVDLAERDLAPGQVFRAAIAIAPGRSPAEAYGRIARLLGATGTLRGSVRSRSGGGAATATLEIALADKKILPAYPDAEGSFEVALPPGTYALKALDLGRPAEERQAAVEAGKAIELTIAMEPPSRVRFSVAEERAGGRKIPCKVQFLGLDGAKDPEFGVQIQAHGCLHQYHSERGEFTVAAPPGKYRVIVTRGIEYSHHEESLELLPGREASVQAVLRRVVDTRGWVSTDFHNHSTPSGDNYCGTDDRLINLAAEHVEFAPATEHNRLYDWKPHLERLGLAGEIATVTGIELTGPNAHFNAFPLKPVPHTQDNGAPVWVEDPRIDALMLREHGGGGPDRWVQINHPSVGKFFRDRDGDGVADGGYEGLEELIDAAEVWSTEILSGIPFTEYTLASGAKAKRENRTFAWLQLLNVGRRMWCVAVSDAHSVFGNGVGGWRTYIPSSIDDPAAIDYREIIRNAKAGRMVMTNGPFLEVALDDGTLPGGMTRAAGELRVKVRVQTNTWVNIDRVQVLVNGRQPPELSFTRAGHPSFFERRSESLRFEAEIPVRLREDAHLIVAAVGEAYTLKTGYGNSWQSGMHPSAFTNPIFVDVDGNGFKPNGDTLGHPLPLGAEIR
jgi:hypothetical protein